MSKRRLIKHAKRIITGDTGVCISLQRYKGHVCLWEIPCPILECIHIMEKSEKSATYMKFRFRVSPLLKTRL